MIDVARAAFSQVEYRKTSPVEDIALRDRDPLSTELMFRTLIIDENDAQVFSADILEIRAEGMCDWKMQAKADQYQFAIGDTTTVFYPRFGLENGRDFIIKGIKREQGGLMTTLTLYGPKPL